MPRISHRTKYAAVEDAWGCCLSQSRAEGCHPSHFQGVISIKKRQQGGHVRVGRCLSLHHPLEVPHALPLLIHLRILSLHHGGTAGVDVPEQPGKKAVLQSATAGLDVSGLCCVLTWLRAQMRPLRKRAQSSQGKSTQGLPHESCLKPCRKSLQKGKPARGNPGRSLPKASACLVMEEGRLHQSSWHAGGTGIASGLLSIRGFHPLTSTNKLDN